MCLAHFISTSYRKLEELNRSTHTWAVGGPAWDSARKFVKQCVQIGSSFSQEKHKLTNLERAQLVDITIWASELGQRLRRTPRNPFAVTIRLRSEKPGNSWEEETFTLDISRHGARAKCQHLVKTDDVLKVHRLDSGEQAVARVVWQRQTTPHTHEIGIEFIQGGDGVRR
jgi:hypothetical protein